jgi:hypothetical protein
VLRLAPVLDAITVDDPMLRIAHLGDGRYDVDDILATLNKTPSDPSSAPLQFALYNLSLNGGAVDFADRTPTGVRQHSGPMSAMDTTRLLLGPKNATFSCA